jgi:hypothetical protein
MDANVEWLKHRVEQYRANTTDACEAIDDFDELDKLGQGFMSADPLEHVDIGDGSVPRPTFINQNLEADFKDELIVLLKEYIDYFALNYTEMSGLSRELVEHRLPIKKDSGLSSKAPTDLILQFMIGFKRRLIGYCKWGLFNHASMWSGFLIVPVEKKDSRKIRVCIDFRDLNRATPRDEYSCL